MTIRRYQSYQESAFRWIKEIPDNWEIAPLAKLAEVIDPQPDHRAPAIAEGTHGHPYIGIRDIHPDGTVNIETARTVEEEALIKQESSFTIDPGDLIFCKVGTLGLPRIIRPSCRIALSATLVLIKAKRDQESAFLRYSLDAQSTYAQIGELATGSTRSALGIQQIRKFRIANPPRQDQRTIASFLDRETAKIDALIAEQQRLIELLQEKRRAVISHAVTKGLNPNAPMKDSGVDWLGEVPEHWEVKSCRYVASIGRGASPRPAGDPHYFGGDFIPWVTVAEITRDSSMELDSTQECLTEEGAANSSEFAAGTVIYSNSGATLGVPKILRISCCANDGVVGFRNLDASLKPEFLYHFLWQLTSSIREWAKQGQGQPNLNTDIIKSIKITVPPEDEQADIVDTLESSVSVFDSLVNEAVNAQSLLSERRSALISAAVTGQIDVRGLAEAEAGEQ